MALILAVDDEPEALGTIRRVLTPSIPFDRDRQRRRAP